MKIDESKISQRGSTVIPTAIRTALNLKEGDYMEWHILNQHIEVKKKES